MTAETPGETAKTLRDAPPSKDRVIAYFQLVAGWQKVDESRSSFFLWPLAEAVRQSFYNLARGDRGDALAMSDDFKLKELAAAARLGVYQSSSRPDANSWS
ncbi:MAG TPA: hypothetical protein VEQ40_13325 [Pyrinomonadaceae bacterium]|nr:hypothetical protein [Pyrinomonadaceae bacterium]